MIGAAEENPSRSLNSAGEIGMPSTLVGSAPSGRSRRRPVAVALSSVSYSADGQGVMQLVPPSGLHSGAVPTPLSSPHATAASSAPHNQDLRIVFPQAVTLGATLPHLDPGG